MKRWDISAPVSSMYSESPDGEWVEWADVAESQKRLDEATGLLQRVQKKGPTRGDGALNGDIKTFLSRAPTPEPSNVQDDLPTNRATAELMERAESAEAQLAAVRDVTLRTEQRVTLYPGLKGSTYYAAYLEILAQMVLGEPR